MESHPSSNTRGLAPERGRDGPGRPGGVHKGHFLVELSDIKESREELAPALSRCAGAKFRSATTPA